MDAFFKLAEWAAFSQPNFKFTGWAAFSQPIFKFAEWAAFSQPIFKFAECVATSSTAEWREWRAVHRFLQVRRMCGDVEHRVTRGIVFFKFAACVATSSTARRGASFS